MYLFLFYTANQTKSDLGPLTVGYDTQYESILGSEVRHSVSSEKHI